MDKFLPESLLEIMQTIGKRNFFNGFKIYSSGHKTNIVIHFLDLPGIGSVHPCETEGIHFEENSALQLKTPSLISKRRSPSSQIRDQQRVEEHVKDISVKENFVSQVSSNLESTTSNSECAPDCDDPILLKTEECQQMDTQEKDSENTSILSKIGEPECDAAKISSDQDVDNLDSGEDKNFQGSSGNKNQNYNNSVRRNDWQRHRPRRYRGQFGNPFGRPAYHRPYFVENASPRLRASLDEIHANIARARGYDTYYDT